MTAADIAHVVGEWTSIPVGKLVETEAEKLANMEARLVSRLVGQEEAVSAVADAIRRNRTGVSAPGRPVGSFLFLGPTGVGKTEMAKALAEFLFDDENRLIRVDMSEFQERHEGSKLIGSPPGYVGFGEGGQLTEKVHRQPYSVVLLDEMEKAYPDVLSLLLQVLDEGRLSDGQGRTVDFKNCVVIVTSNLGSEAREEGSVGFGRGEGDTDGEGGAQARTIAVVSRRLRPELINRFDKIVVFRPLSKESLVRIACRELESLSARLTARQVRLTWDPMVPEHLVQVRRDRRYGARPIRRAVIDFVEAPVALMLARGEMQEGGEIRLEVDGGKVGARVTAQIPIKAILVESTAGGVDI